MALTENNLAMIKAIADNDIHTAKLAAIASLSEDKTQKNAKVISMYKKMFTGNASVLMSNLPSDLKTFLVGESHGGFDPKKYYLRTRDEKIISSVIKMRRVSDKLADIGIPYKNTTLLYGPSGAGKTELGRYIAYRLHIPFFYIRFVSTIDSYLGSTAKNIHKVFEFCKSIPCVLMLDEIDCIAVQRSAGKGADGELERTTISVMQDIDELPNHVVLIGATNRFDILDDGVLSRFVLQHEVTPMEETEVLALLRQYIEATGTQKYVTDTRIAEIAKNLSTPRTALSVLIRHIGDGMYQTMEDVIEEDETEPTQDSNVWQVTYTWKSNIVAENEESAIALGRRERTYGSRTAYEERYTAKPAEFLYS